MKLLFMEDEAQILDGVIAEVNWKSLGILEVYTAKNGEIGYALAKKVEPDIILSDIRMPRLDGISTVKKLRKILPKCSIIFISAYTEKNYFKEAIRLKAVSFIEKPIDSDELKKVLEEAVQEQLKYHAEEEKDRKVLLYNRQNLVNRINRGKITDRNECLRELEEAGIEMKSIRYFASLILVYQKGEEREYENQWNLFCAQNENRAENAPVGMLWSQKHWDQLIYHLFMKNKNQYLEMINWLEEQVKEVGRYYIMAGSLQNSVMKLQQSYYDASLLFNQAWFLPYGSVVIDEREEISVKVDFDAWKAEVVTLLTKNCLNELKEWLEELSRKLLENTGIMYSFVKEFYYSVYGELWRYSEKNSLLINREKHAFPSNGNFMEIHSFIISYIQKIVDAENHAEDGMIVQIKRYVKQNYRNPWLSTKEIAEVMNISVSHMCVVFKKETGITLNQYMTEVRINAAEILLDNPRNSIKKVAEDSGYADSGYFSRAFKKYTGMTPSEYREDTK